MDCFVKSVANNFYPIGRDAGRKNERSAKLVRGQHDFGEPSSLFVGFVFIHQLIEQRNILESFVPFVTGLIEHVDKVFLAPGDKRLAREKRVDRKGAALYLAALHSEINVLPGDISGDHVEFGADRLFEQLGHIIG